MNREEAIKRTGQMMLQGWTLTGMHCPECNAALVSRRKQLHCPGCDLPVRTEEQQQQQQSVSSIAVTESSSIKFTGIVPNIKLSTEEPRSLVEAKREWDRARKKRDEISVKLGEQMLNGCTLMSEACPKLSCGGTTLVGKKNHPLFCVCCESSFMYSDETDELNEVYVDTSILVHTQHDYYKTNSNNIITTESTTTDVPLKSRQRVPIERYNYNTTTSDDVLIVDEPYCWLGNTPPLIDLSQAPYLDTTNTQTTNTHDGGVSKKKDDPTAQLSAKLLLGWAMLDETCTDPACSGSVPLMRDKKGQKHCFECNQVTLNGEVVSNTSSALTSTTATTTATSAVSSVPMPSPTSLPTSKQPESAVPQPALSSLYQASQSIATLPQQNTQTTKETVRTEITGDVANSISIVKQKIMTVSVLLQQSEDIGTSIRLAELLCKLAEASKALDSI